MEYYFEEERYGGGQRCQICALGYGSRPSPSLRIILGSYARTMAVSIITVASLHNGARNDCIAFWRVLGSQLP